MSSSMVRSSRPTVDVDWLVGLFCRRPRVKYDWLYVSSLNFLKPSETFHGVSEAGDRVQIGIRKNIRP